MAKDPEEKKIKKEKKDKKEKKEKRAETDGVTKVKKEKKEKKARNIADVLETELQKDPDVSMVSVDAGDVTMVDEDEGIAELKGALVPFANPLAEDAKDVKKVLKTVKKSAKSKTLRRGVKEVVKALRKSPNLGPASSDISNPPAVCIIAADISPMDVISHIPVLCEDHNIPYIYVKSRAELGEASATKRPTSVVLVAKEKGKKGKDIKEEDASEFEEAYGELVKIVVKANKNVRK